MKQATLTRNKKDAVQVMSSLTSGSLASDGVSLIALEKLSTLISEGKYVCVYTRSNRLSALALKNWLAKNPTLTEVDAPDDVKNYKTYELQNVPNHTGVRIHACNFSRLLEACVSPGLTWIDLDNDGELDATSSVVAVNELQDYMGLENFELTITSNYETVSV